MGLFDSVVVECPHCSSHVAELTAQRDALNGDVWRLGDSIIDKDAALARVLRCVTMAMGCISPLARNRDERLAWYRLLDAVEGREPRDRLEP